MGTYTGENNTCMPCKSNVLNCDSTTGESMDQMSSIACDSSCNTCFWNTNFCIKCATGKKLASHGRCVDKCPASTTEEKLSDDSIMCKECSKGCLKCSKETDQCPAQNMTNGTSTGATGGSAAGTSTNMVARCVKCDKDLGFYLFQDKCVRMCPLGTYGDKVTGWCVKCDCNCGNGGCIDKYTCKSCPMDGMSIDKETGRCKCDTTVTGAWADDWKSFTITINSLKVKFRDLKAEQANPDMNKNKICRIGNEGSMLDNKGKYIVYLSYLDVNITMSDVPINRCGNMTLSQEELKAMKEEFGNMEVEKDSTSEQVPSGSSTNGAPNQSTMPTGPSMGGTQGGMTGQMGGNMTSSTGMTGGSTNNTTGGTAPKQDDYVQKISNTTQMCPAKKEKINEDELMEMGIDSVKGGFERYIKSLGTTFGNIKDEDLMNYESPTQGLKFTSAPTDLCGALFDEDTLKNFFKNPKCTLTMTDTKTMIKVEMGENAKIHSDFILKVQPNIFVDGCDWPVLNVIKLTNGANPMSLKVDFENIKDTIVVCQNVTMNIDSEGNIGELNCVFMIEGAYAQDGTKITTTDVANLITAMNNATDTSGTSGVMKATKEQLEKFKQANVDKLRIKGKCMDSFGQEQVISKDIKLSSGATDVTMKNEVSVIQYDPEKAYPLIFAFNYAN